MRPITADPVYIKRRRPLKVFSETIASTVLRSLLPKGTKRPPSQLKKLLIIRHNALGDAVASSVLIDALHSEFKGMNIEVLAGPYNQAAFAWIPGVSRIHVWPEGFWERVALVKQLRRQGYDIVMQTLFDENYVSRSVVARIIAGRGWLIGHDRGTPFAKLLDEPVTLPFGAYPAKLLALMARLQPHDLDALTRKFRHYRLAFPADLETVTARTLDAAGLQAKRFILLNISARQATRDLSTPQAIFLAQSLTQGGHQVLLSCAPGDRERATHIAQAVPALKLCDFASLGHAMCTASKAQLYVGPDTGTAHFAASSQTPCVSLFSAAGRPESWSPYGTNYIAIQAHPGHQVSDIDAGFILRQVNSLLNGHEVMAIMKAPTDFYAPCSPQGTQQG